MNVQKNKNLVLEGRKLQERFKKSLNETIDVKSHLKTWKFREQSNRSLKKTIDGYLVEFQRTLNGLEYIADPTDPKVMKFAAGQFEKLDGFCDMLISHFKSVQSEARKSKTAFEKEIRDDHLHRLGS